MYSCIDFIPNIQPNFNLLETKSSKLYNKRIIVLLLSISGIIAFAGVFIMTDIGQLLKIDKAVLVAYFRYHMFYMTISCILLIIAVYINSRIKVIKKGLVLAFAVFWIITILSTKYMAPYLVFSTHQYNAEYLSIGEAHDYLKDDDIVFALDFNGVQKAYPREYIWQAHIAGGDFGEDNVLFTYCVLTNLPTPYLNNKENPMDIKVLAQANNNLLIWETNSGEIIQQINHTCEFSGRKLNPLPLLEMTWAGYKKLYPEGTVFFNEFTSPIEKFLNKLISIEEVWYGDDWMFETVNLGDNRLPSKEQIIGLTDKNDQLAITKSFIKEQGIYNTKVGNKHIALAYFPEYETIAAFNRMKNGSIIEVKDIDVFGNTLEQGKLERTFVYNGVLWAVWAYYFPESNVLKK